MNEDISQSNPLWLVTNMIDQRQKASFVQLTIDPGSILPTFYAKLLWTQIPNAQKWQSSHQCLFTLLGFAHVKDAHKMLVKLTPDFSLMDCCILKQVLTEQENLFRLFWILNSIWKAIATSSIKIPVFSYQIKALSKRLRKLTIKMKRLSQLKSLSFVNVNN